MTSSLGRQFAFPPLTNAVKALMLVNVGVFLVNMVFAGALAEWFGVSLGGLIEFFGLGSLRLVTYQFVHSYVDVGHILFNMLFLYFFGTMVESEVGQRGLIKLYLVSGVVGGAVQLLFGLGFGTTSTLIVGASGSCYGIMVYAARMAPHSKVWFFGMFPVQLRVLVGILVFIGVYSTLLAARHGDAGGGIAHGAHLGGALWGWLAFGYFRNSYISADRRPLWGGMTEWWRRRRRDRQAHADREQQATLDELLDKVHREGMSALTEAERRFLERASRNMRR